MKGKILLLSLVFLLNPVFVLASSEVEIFSQQYLSSPAYLESGIEWRVYNNNDTTLYKEGGGLLLQNEGDAYLVYPISFSYKDFDKLIIIYSSSKPLGINVIPNIGSTGFSTYELRKKFMMVNEINQAEFSLRLPFFKNPTEDIGINFYSNQPSEVTIHSIKLVKNSFAEIVGQFFKDYFTVSSYSPFTVNLIPTPRVFGYSAMIYFLPIVILALLFLFIHPKTKFRQISLMILIVFWLVIDFRMIYEFINYNVKDYQSYVKPDFGEKSLRNYSDFYQFAELVNNNVSDDSTVNFYNFGSDHFPRILQYQVYPTIIIEEGAQGSYFAFYNYPGVTFNESDGRLYKADEAITEAGEVIAKLNDNSFIFQIK